MNAGGKCFQIGHAVHTLGGFFRTSQGRQQHGQKKSKNPNNNKQFN
jgi:hypothetical protein